MLALNSSSCACCYLPAVPTPCISHSTDLNVAAVHQAFPNRHSAVHTNTSLYEPDNYT